MKKTKYPFRGIVSTVISPFYDDGSFDIGSYEKEVEMACAAGVAGFLVPCVASEMPFLSAEEQKTMVKATVEVAAGRGKTIASITSPSGDERLLQMEEYLKFGVDGININIPFTTRDEYCRSVEAIDAQKPPFVMLQDVDFNGPGMPDEVLLECFQRFESVIGIKIEVHNSNDKYTRLLQATDGKIHISSGWGNDQMIELLDRGVDVCMPSGLFEIFTTIFDLHSSGQREKAKKLFYDILPVVAFTRQDGTINRKFHKKYFQRLGVFKTSASREEEYYDACRESYAQEMIDKALFIRDHIDGYK